jgi:KaiC/GvpD/RAD55 family RecA-like ATPase
VSRKGKGSTEDIVDDPPPTTAGENGSGEKTEELRRWLSGDQSGLLDWLSEEGAQETASNLPEAATESERIAEIKRTAELMKAETERLNHALDEGRPGGSAASSGLIAEQIKGVLELQDALRGQVEILAKIDTELRGDLDAAFSSLPKSQEEIARKQVELREREILLEGREHGVAVPTDGVAAEGGAGLEQRYQAELREKEVEFKEVEREYRSKIDYLAEELKTKGLELQQSDEELKILRMGSNGSMKVVEGRLKDLQEKEKRILLMDEEVARLRIEIRERDDEMKKIKDILGYKEQELLRREEDLDYREKLLTTERTKFDSEKKEATGIEEVEMQKRLEGLKSEVQLKEEELLTKEKYLNAKAEELRLREQGVIEDEILKREEERGIEITATKAKTGNSRFDDLLLGGIPFGSNIMIHGPPFVGKDVMIGQFIMEGLRKGIPAIWVITDKTPKDVRMEMAPIISGYEEYERLGLVRYVDAYSVSMGEAADDPYTSYVSEPTDHEKIMEATEKIAKEFKEKHKYYRLAFRSLSTLIAYSDPNTAFRFLSPFCGRRKRDQAVSMYSIEKGVHGEQEIQMLGSIMDGMIDFKLDQLKNYFSVQGVCDVQSRSYIRYTVGKHGLSIGSFSLDHIR